MSRLERSLLKSLRRAIAQDKSTWQLYKDKPFFDRLSRVLYTSDILDPFFKVYYSIRSFINNCKRVIEYAPIVWEHRTWDHGFVLRFQVKLYEDLYKGCYEKGHHVYTRNESRKLRTVIGLLKRLQSESYGDWHYDYLEKKYGESDIYFPKVTEPNGRKYTTMRNRREDNLTPAQQKQYEKDRKRLLELEEYQQKKDFEMLGKYITKYSKRWWD